MLENFMDEAPTQRVPDRLDVKLEDFMDDVGPPEAQRSDFSTPHVPDRLDVKLEDFLDDVISTHVPEKLMDEFAPDAETQRLETDRHVPDTFEGELENFMDDFVPDAEFSTPHVPDTLEVK